MTTDHEIAKCAILQLMALADAAQYLLNHVRVNPASRWPCYECGRPGPDAPLRGIASTLDDGSPISGSGPILHGCWSCNAHDQIEGLDAATACAYNTVRGVADALVEREPPRCTVRLDDGRACGRPVQTSPSGVLCPVHGGGAPFRGDIDRAPHAIPDGWERIPGGDKYGGLVPGVTEAEQDAFDDATSAAWSRGARSPFERFAREPSIFGTPPEPGIEGAVRAAADVVFFDALEHTAAAARTAARRVGGAAQVAFLVFADELDTMSRPEPTDGWHPSDDETP